MPGQGIHNRNFGLQLKAKMDELGIENAYVHTPDAKGRDVGKEMLDFFRKPFAKAKQAHDPVRRHRLEPGLIT